MYPNRATILRPSTSDTSTDLKIDWYVDFLKRVEKVRIEPIRTKHVAVFGAIRPGCDVLTVMVCFINNSSIKRFSPVKYSRSVKPPTMMINMPMTIVLYRLLNISRSMPDPHRINPSAVLNCMGTNKGRICINVALPVNQPVTTTNPNTIEKTEAPIAKINKHVDNRFDFVFNAPFAIWIYDILLLIEDCLLMDCQSVLNRAFI